MEYILNYDIFENRKKLNKIKIKKYKIMIPLLIFCISLAVSMFFIRGLIQKSDIDYLDRSEYYLTESDRSRIIHEKEIETAKILGLNSLAVLLIIILSFFIFKIRKRYNDKISSFEFHYKL